MDTTSSTKAFTSTPSAHKRLGHAPGLAEPVDALLPSPFPPPPASRGLAGPWLLPSECLSHPTVIPFLFFVFCFLGPHPQHMEVPRLGVESELRLLAYTTATAMQDLS